MAETYKILITEDNAEKELTREDVVEMLYNDVATVTFTKKDGSERVMEGTLLQHVLDERAPKIFKPETFSGHVGQLSIQAKASLFEFDIMKSSLLNDSSP